jgi:hypothetical protein
VQLVYVMLCSHSKKFIYFKTKKTGGTSVEVFFEPYCHDADAAQEEHRDLSISKSGIIGYRGRAWVGKPFYNHMPASEILSRLGSDVFRSYTKFNVVRNPYDKVVSMFWFLTPSDLRDHLKSSSFETARSYFRLFIKSPRFADALDWYIYTIDDKVVSDFIIRFENMHHDLKILCEKLRIEFDPSKLKNFKSDFRCRNEHFSEYYDSDTSKTVQTHFSSELSYFDYSLGS